jgi:uncharacterized protein YlxP (DUF503 family)
MKLKFNQFNVEIDNPTVAVMAVADNLKEKVCSVSILLTTETAKFGVTLDGFTYVDTWEDADIYAWVDNELKKYEV